MKFPRLYDMELNEVELLTPSRLSVTQNLTPLSTAEMELLVKQYPPEVRQFVEIFDQNGSLGLYRVASVQLEGKQSRVSLEHSIVTLEDSTAPAEAELTGSMRHLLETILSWQVNKRWTLGEVDVPEDQVYSLSASNQITLQALLDAVALARGYGLTFDQSSVPWVVSLKALPEDAFCQCRMNRNTSRASITMDEADMCTRVTHPLLPDGHLDSSYAEYYGVISRPLDAPEDATAETVLSLAQEYLSVYESYRLNLEIDAVDLAKETGEDVDRFELGKFCIIFFDEDRSIGVSERIISIYRPDVINAPEEARLTLASMVRSTQASLAGLRSSMARSNRSNAQQFKYIREEIDKIVIEAPSVELVARVTKIEEVNEDQELQINEALVRLDGAEAALLLKADQTAVSELGVRVSDAEIAIDGANAAIALKASQTTVDELGERVSQAEIDIDGANSLIALKADKIDLQGYVTIADLDAFKADISDLWADELRTSYVSADSVVAGAGDFDSLVSGQLSASSFSLGGTSVSSYDLTMGSLVSASVFSGGDINLSHSHAVTVSDDGTVTLGEVSAEGGNFKIADTKVYKDGVSAAIESVTLSADGWNGLTNTVRASNGKTYVVPFPTVNLTGGDSFDSSHQTVVNAVTPGSNAYITRLTVDASDVYDDGYSSGAAGVTLSADGWNGLTNTVRASNGKYLMVGLPSFTTSGGDYFDENYQTTVYFMTPGSSAYLASKTVNASNVYDAGYYYGYAVARDNAVLSVDGTDAVVTFSDGTTKRLSLKDYVTARADVKYVSSTSTTITVRGWAYAYFNSVNCASVYRSATYDTAD